LNTIEKEKEETKILEATTNPNFNFSPRKYVKSESKCDGPKRSTSTEGEQKSETFFFDFFEVNVLVNFSCYLVNFGIN